MAGADPTHDRRLAQAIEADNLKGKPPAPDATPEVRRILTDSARETGATIARRRVARKLSCEVIPMSSPIRLTDAELDAVFAAAEPILSIGATRSCDTLRTLCRAVPTRALARFTAPFSRRSAPIVHIPT